MFECGSPTISEDTIGSSVYLKIPFNGPSAAALNDALISSAVVSFSTSQTKSVKEPVGVGTRTAPPSSFPFK